MACSIDRRIDTDLYAAKKISTRHNTACLGKYLFHFLSLSCVMASCLWSTFASADTDNPFLHALNQTGQVQAGDISLQKTYIAELENQNTLDTYTPELSEAYLELAGKFTAVGNHTDALKTYNRALQIVRVSDGLNSPNQLPILQAQLHSMEKLQQWKRYDSTLNLINLISQDQFPIGDDKRIKVLNQISKWQLRAAEEGLLERVQTKAMAVADLYEKEIQHVETDESAVVSDYGFSSLKLGRAYTRLTMAKITLDKPIREYRSLTSTPTQASSQCQPIILAGGESGGPCMAIPMPNLNYYQAPAKRKKQDNAFYLEQLRTAILDAGETLEKKKDVDNRDSLIKDFRFLAESYTKIVTNAQVN